MITLNIVTLEKIEKRYTKQWYEYFKKEFKKHFDKVKYIDGVHQSDKIKKGRFLDINKTNKWKAEQVIVMSQMFDKENINDGDTFLFLDGWHFGITALKYMAQLNKINIKIYTYLHAGTWDSQDFITQAGLRPWAKYNELGWLRACDGHFVATNFHKSLITKYFEQVIKKNKIHVVGFPMDWIKEMKKEIGNIDYNIEEKEDLIVFPHRTDPEKCPEKFKLLKKLLPKYKFVITMDVTKNKQEYYNLLKKAKMVFSANKQETFGIGTVEALLLGAIPIVPNKLSYMELYDGLFKYSNFQSSKQKIIYFMNHYNEKHIQNAIQKNQDKIIRSSKESVEKIAKVILYDSNSNRN